MIEDRDKPRSVPSIALAVCAIGLCFGGAIAILVTRSKFVRMFEEFEMELSLIASLAIGPVLPMLFFALAVSGLIKEFVPGCRRIRDHWNLVLLLAGLILFAIYLAGVFSPLMSLLEALS